jgi:signal transduction histidine kinase
VRLTAVRPAVVRLAVVRLAVVRSALAPLVRASTYRRAVHLLLGAVILLPYLLLGAVLARTVTTDEPGRPAMVLIAVVAAVIAAVPPFLGGTRELEIAAARHLLDVDLPESAARPPALETRLRAALWFAAHLAAGGVIAAALLTAVPMALVVFAERAGLTVGGLAGLDVGPLGEGDLWWWTGVGVLLLVGTVYATAGLGALAAVMAPVLLGPSPEMRIAAAEARERQLAERHRLARDLHDSVGHALSATTLQAAAARAVFDTDPAFARRALAAIEEVGRAAVDDLDHVLGVLRDGTAGGAPGPRAPQPTLADLDRLCADVRAGGVDLRVEDAGPVGALPAAVSREGYRIVQEGLTNAARHGAGGPVTLRVGVAGDVLTIELVNALGGGGRGHGRGLAGMRERVALLGGRLTAGRDGGSWRVAAHLPVDRTGPA